jgi:2-C-methyl-D-erythritol 4-phosphate cytidylyltransferase
MATALLAAAGAGGRLGAGTPKAFAEVAGRALFLWSLEALAAAQTIDRVLIAAPPEDHWQKAIAVPASRAAPGLHITVTRGGESRSHSVKNALAASEDADEVLVHDAARPLITPELIDRCVEQRRQWDCDGVVAAARAVDTIKEADAGGRVIATLERSHLWAIQTPQVFTADVLRAALDRGDLTRAYDDAQLVEWIGGDVRIVEAPRQNFKVTTQHDLRMAEWLLQERRGPGC